LSNSNFEAMVLAELAEIKALLLRMPVTNVVDGESEWADTTSAAKRLGMPATKIRDLRRKGYFKLGYHYRIKGGGALNHYNFHIKRVAEVLNTHPSKRKIHEKQQF
jgi:hypothetical protein